MKRFQIVFLVLAAVGCATAATTIHRSFRKGYPVGVGVGVRTSGNDAVLRAPKSARPKTVVVTNRVVLTKAQAERMLKTKKRTGGKPDTSSGALSVRSTR